jgi:hypothetical protein
VATIIDSLVLELGLDASKFTPEASKAVDALRKLQQGAEKHMKPVEDGFNRVVSTFREFQGRLLAISALITGGIGLDRLVEQVMRLNSQMGYLATSLGISTKELTTWQLAGRTVGATSEEIAQGMAHIRQEIADLRIGHGSRLAAFAQATHAFGQGPAVELFNPNGEPKSDTEILLQLSRWYVAQKDRNTATRVLQTEAGLSQGMINFLGLGPAEVQKRLAEAEKLTPTEEQVKKFQGLQKAWAETAEVVEKLQRAIVEDLVPGLERLLKIIRDIINWLMPPEHAKESSATENFFTQSPLGSFLRKHFPGTFGPSTEGSPSAQTPRGSAPTQESVPAGGSVFQQGSAEVNRAIVEASSAYGLDVNTMRSIASIESNMNPGSNANRPTQYKGLFQIGTEEWAKFGGGNIYSARDNAMAAGRMLAAHRAEFREHFGRDPTDAELYMMHQQGLGFYTRGAMTNIGGNPYPGMRGPQTHESFESGWGREVARRKAGFAARSAAPPPAGPDRLRVDKSTPFGRDLGAGRTFDLWRDLGRYGLGARSDASGAVNTNTSSTHIGEMNVSVPPGASPADYASGIRQELDRFDNVQNANMGMV